MNTPVRPYHVLFLCTGNSARSIIAESLINHWGRGNFIGHSAGSFPKGEVHHVALALLKQLGLPSQGWGVPDPAFVEGKDTEQWAAFRDTLRALGNRIKIFVSLPHRSLERMKLEEHVRAIGRAPSP